MPKIVIKEEDYTTPGLGTYANFSVVVPGFVAEGKEQAFKDVADENGIYEVSNQEDFVKNVGTKDGGVNERVFAQPELNPNYNPEDDEPIHKYARTLTGSEFYSTYAGEVYIPTYLGDNQKPADDKGKFYFQIPIYDLAGDEITGYKYYHVTKAGENSWSDAQEYVIIKESNLGQDAQDNIHLGNQMAYELLGLGYTVLFKNLANQTISDSFLKPLEDKANYDFRFIVTGYLNPSKDDNNEIAKLATKRGDCTAICDIPENAYNGEESSEAAINGIINAVKDIDKADKYSTLIVPSLCYNITYPLKDGSTTDRLYSDTKFPGSFHYLACFAHSVRDLNFAEWYAAAGYTRGISKYQITSTSYKFGENAISALEPRFQKDGLTKAVNVIAKFRTNYVLWGNRTAHALGAEGADDGDLVASHFLNIRQLCTTLKKELYVACRRFTFDPNSDVLWINFCNAIRPTLDAMKADQGINDYEIIKVATSQKATLKARIRIVPIEAVEDFDITISLEDSLGDTNITVTE